ncbi:MAG: hypothetical protein WCT37_05420 [Patescibacteria group bacterium]|jgi:hypothetical protein
MAKFFKALTQNENFIIKGLFVATLVVLAVSFSTTSVYSSIITSGSGYAWGYTYDQFTYGYAYSSALPNAVATFSCSSASSTSVTCNWVAGSGASDSTSLEYFYQYLIYYSTASGSADYTSGTLGATVTSQATTSATISGLTSGTAYYFRAYMKDTLFSHGVASGLAAATPGASAGSASGGGGSGGSSSTSNNPVVTVVPTGTTTTATVTVSSPTSAASLAAEMGVARDTKAEVANATKVASDVAAFKVTATADQKTAMANFVTYGISLATVKLGSGERRAVLRDYLETVGRANVDWADVERMTTGQKPVNRNLAKEQAQVSAVLAKFKALVGHTPNFQNAAEDLAWNTMMYRIRFTRNLTVEKSGIVEFRDLFGKNPVSPLDWSVVRAAGYALGK